MSCSSTSCDVTEHLLAAYLRTWFVLVWVTFDLISCMKVVAPACCSWPNQDLCRVLVVFDRPLQVSKCNTITRLFHCGAHDNKKKKKRQILSRLNTCLQSGDMASRWHKRSVDDVTSLPPEHREWMRREILISWSDVTTAGCRSSTCQQRPEAARLSAKGRPAWHIHARAHVRTRTRTPGSLWSIFSRGQDRMIDSHWFTWLSITTFPRPPPQMGSSCFSLDGAGVLQLVDFNCEHKCTYHLDVFNKQFLISLFHLFCFNSLCTF